MYKYLKYLANKLLYMKKEIVTWNRLSDKIYQLTGKTHLFLGLELDFNFVETLDWIKNKFN